MTSERALFHARISELITRLSDGSRDDDQRDRLLIDMADYQTRTLTPYGRFAAQRKIAAPALGLDRIAALPTDAFRFTRMASHPSAEDVRVFRSSGTTQSERSVHAFRDLSLYDLAAQVSARYALFPDVKRMRLVLLAPSEQELADSSLSYMLARFIAWFGSEAEYVFRAASLDLNALDRSLRAASAAREPVALLGTSFAFVHALDGLAGTRFTLPHGSRIMQTGGFKGRSREIAPDELRAQLADTFGIAEPWIVAEYGMTELSSQLYETTLRDVALGREIGARRLWAPGWVRAVPVDPDTLLARKDEQDGLLRIDDAANLDSVCAIQTADVAYRHEDGVIVRGRAQGAIARGCSLTADELLGRDA
jgi:hypothetical protein